jgi:hypothetical protein
LGSWYEHPLQSICILQHSPISVWFYPCSYICNRLKMPKKSQINEYSDPSRSLKHEYWMHAPIFCRLFHADSIWTSFTIDWYCDFFSLSQSWNLGRERFTRIRHSLGKQSAAIGIINQFLWVRLIPIGSWSSKRRVWSLCVCEYHIRHVGVWII